MNPPRRNLTSAQAAAHLGVSAKTLRLYEEASLLVPGRSAAGWRLYGPDDLERAATIVALRSLGLSLMQVVRSMNGDAMRHEVTNAGLGTQAMCQALMKQALIMLLRRHWSQADGSYARDGA